MNRKIKFRAYDKVRKEYLSAGRILLTINSGKNPVDSVQYLDVLRDPNLYADRFVIEQYTGYDDCQGTPMYEGDIVKLKESVEATVEWKGGGFHFYGLEDVNGRRPDYAPLPSNRMRVIGSIHDTPDLLNGK